ncbi:hypothetical protein Kisp01_65070 [Kineosporia sp. NBRC 101677]|uniref:aminotransferase class IV n=1 Tax=Kineosporia sp. NBRC 101677 TaxID=3032197 RepID=UPI0024A1E635|nr:aminotransferase class IV [Kineosporia sp. NBRC 101677]GLY19493.1 hypothetical protein Kisp01_65070 [Kineosporia sp. NBRC 101677]
MKQRWLGRGAFAPTNDTTVAVDVADSWLVDEGRCRGLDLHRERFTRSCAHPDAGLFFDDVLPLLPRTGRWFPRIEFHQGEFRAWVRPAPPPSSSVSLWFPDRPDPRKRPLVKGPDLETLLKLRAQGGDGTEAVLVSPEGWVREGALSSLMWWRGDVLCGPPDGPGLLPSVTRALVLRIAARRGQKVVFEQVGVRALDGLVCWSMSALHGIRSAGPVGSIDGRRQSWQEELLGLAK